MVPTTVRISIRFLTLLGQRLLGLEIRQSFTPPELKNLVSLKVDASDRGDDNGTRFMVIERQDFKSSSLD